MKKYLLISFSFSCLVFAFHGNAQANTTIYQQLAATTTKIAKSQTLRRHLPPKPSPFSGIGKINIQLQYGMTERTGNQLHVDGFNLAPIFVAGHIESQDIVRTGHRVDLLVSRVLAGGSRLSLNLPYQQESEELTNDAGQVTTQTRKKVRGLGDIRLTYSKQLFKNNHQLPLISGNVTWKTTTGKDAYESTKKLGLGSGFHGLRTGIQIAKQDDPIFLYAGLGHTWNLKDKKSDMGTINPGNSYDFSLGVTYALTDSFRMNFGLAQAWTMKTTINSARVVNSDQHTAGLAIGGRLKISAKRSISINTKIGLNEATPGFQMQVSIPLKM